MTAFVKGFTANRTTMSAGSRRNIVQMSVSTMRLKSPYSFCTPTNTTLAKSQVRSPIVSGFRCEFVPFGAMRFLSVPRGRRITAQGINSWRHIFEMGWVNTTNTATKMIDLEIGGHDPHKHSVCNAMSATATALKRKARVAIWVQSAHPKPTRTSVKAKGIADLNLAEKTGKKFSVYGKAVKIFGNHLSLLNRFNGLGATAFTELLCPLFYTTLGGVEC